MPRRTVVVLSATLALLAPGYASAASPGPDRTGRAEAVQPPWRPAPGTTWQWQLDGKVDQSVDAAVYDIDGFENSAAVVASLHAKGRKVICYVSAGSWENFRPDAAAFPASVKGRSNGWAGEKWLDIRQLAVLEPLLGKRFDMCRDKGFDAVEPDLLDGYTNRTGFPLTAADQLAFNRMVAALAHERGMGVALKNDVEQTADLVDDFDFAVNEECAQYSECAALTPFTKAGKAVLHVEYALPTGKFCAQTRKLGFSSMQKHLNLDAWRKPC